MRIDVITIFPDYLAPLREALLGKAIDRGRIEVGVHDLRDWTHDVHRSVDDSPYGGGPGMVMKPQVWGEALDEVCAAEEGGPAPRLVVPTPAGRPFTQRTAVRWSAEPRLVFACGRYEGIDQRVIDDAATRMPVEEVSIGDYVLVGGEVAALVMIEAVARLLRIAEAADAPVVIVHLTNREALDEVAFARARGQRVYVETCPQYLTLDDGVYYDANWSMAARYVCAPPIRAEENQRALWRGLRRGEIQTISTDHCSFTLAQKDMGREDFTKIPGGLPGVETRGEVVYTRGVAAGRMTVAGMCRALCENPAKLYGLYPRKGVIAAGSDADIVVYDPRASHILSARDMVTKAGYTPFEGLRTEGGIAKVYLRGSLMVEDGRIVGGPEGQYLRRGLCTL